MRSNGCAGEKAGLNFFKAADRTGLTLPAVVCFESIEVVLFLE